MVVVVVTLASAVVVSIAAFILDVFVAVEVEDGTEDCRSRTEYPITHSKSTTHQLPENSEGPLLRL